MAETIQQHLRMAWGDTPVWEVTVTNPAGVPQNITGATMRFTMKARASDPDSAAVATKTVGAGISLTDPTVGKAQVVLAVADTSKLAAARRHLLQYDWKMVLGGITTRVAYGTIVVEPAMSRVV